MPHEPIAVANNFLEIAEASDEHLTPMKLQKLVFFSHGWHLGFNHGPLSTEEAEAWEWGPVFPSLYHAVKTWGSGPILEPITKIVLKPRRAGRRRERAVITPSIPAGEDQFALDLLDRIWEVYGEMTALQLSALSHETGGPWEQARQSRIRSAVISNQSIAEHFGARIAANAGR